MIKSKVYLGLAFLVLLILLSVGCGRPTTPEGTLTAAELLSEPSYETDVNIYGRVDGLGEVQCLCFLLISGGKSVQVWYDTMVEDDGTAQPAVSVEGIRNGDKVIITGELKGEGGIHYSKDDFWAKSIAVP